MASPFAHSDVCSDSRIPRLVSFLPASTLYRHSLFILKIAFLVCKIRASRTLPSSTSARDKVVTPPLCRRERAGRDAYAGTGVRVDTHFASMNVDVVRELHGAGVGESANALAS